MPDDEKKEGEAEKIIPPDATEPKSELAPATLDQVLKALRLIYKQNEEILRFTKLLSGVKLTMLEAVIQAKAQQDMELAKIAKAFGGEIVK